MNNDTVITVEGLYKKFCIDQRKSIVYGGLDVFRSMVGFPPGRDMLRNREIWALEDINFEVRKGETLGIVGVNGAGKSTLLRVLSGIYPPDAGKVSVRGTIGALIAAGAGFHPDMTGRENIYLNGAIIGLKKKEVDRKLEEIIEFAELGEFIDTPVRFYSSGMYVRLGFAIAVNIRPNILVIDEVLSVGDLTFQNKCFRKLKELRESVDAVIFVSHNLDHIRNVCSAIIVLDAGKIIYRGSVAEGLILYQTHVDGLKRKSLEAKPGHEHVVGKLQFDSDAELESIQIENAKDGQSGKIFIGDDIVITTKFKAFKEIAKPQFSVGILDDRNSVVLWQIDHDTNVRFSKLSAGGYKLRVVFKNPHLVAGLYRVNVAIRNSDTGELLTKHTKMCSFLIQGNVLARGIVHCDSGWELTRL